jgi:hypothetical protein
MERRNYIDQRDGSEAKDKPALRLNQAHLRVFRG